MTAALMLAMLFGLVGAALENKCGPVMVDTGFPQASAMPGSVMQGFKGSDADCCALCLKISGSPGSKPCVGFTHRSDACYLHPEPLGSTASAHGANSSYVGGKPIPTPSPSPAPPRKCPPTEEGVGFPQAPTMRGTIKSDFNGSTHDCCELCWATLAHNAVGCVAFTRTDDACLLHPPDQYLGNRTAIANATGVASGITQPCHANLVAPMPPQNITKAPTGAKNVLFFVSDDMRPEMFKAYGRNDMITPTFDALAARSTVFRRAYCQQAICAPSRNSFMSGRRPQRTQSWNFKDHFREAPGGLCGNETARTEDGRTWYSFPGWFKSHGYTVLGGGKVFHDGFPPYNDGTNLPGGGPSWSPDKPYTMGHDKKGCTSDYIDDKEQLACPDNSRNLTEFIDHANLESMLDDLEYASAERKSTGKPFFIAFGLHRPHLPFHFPANFNETYNIWEAYGPTDDISLPQHECAPKGMPGIAFTYEMDGMQHLSANGTGVPIPGPDIPGDDRPSLDCPVCGPPAPPNVTRILRKSYYASVSWVDFLVGKMLAQLDALGHADDTVIAFVGDHGYQLGEHNIWGKHTNFELGTRVPLIIHAPGQADGIVTDAIVESLDIYPTVAKLAGLPNPPDLDGIDLSPLWTDPSQEPKGVAFSEYPRCAPPDAAWTPEPGATNPQSCIHTKRANFTIMGYSVRTDEWRATFWMWWDGLKLAGDFGRPPVAQELYNHLNDTGTEFDNFENENVAADNPDVVKTMFDMAKKQWAKEA